MKLVRRVAPGSRVSLRDIDPDDTGKWKKHDHASKEALSASQERLMKLQARLYAEQKASLLIILQAMDTGGKDGVIHHVMAPLDARGCRMVSWKAPNAADLAHDFLWRIHHECPKRGEIAIFNRSHYEDVLVVRVMELMPKKVWSKRYQQINAFEELLVANGTHILKVFLHISKEEQKSRLETRLADPEKRWKYDPSDAVARTKWSEYQKAYEAVLEKTSTAHAPWHIVPANVKWSRDVAVAALVADALETIDPAFPKSKLDWKNVDLDGGSIRR